MDCVDRMQPICSKDVVSFCSNMDIHKDAMHRAYCSESATDHSCVYDGGMQVHTAPPKNGGFLLRHHLHPAGLSKPSVSTLHSAGVTVAFEMGAGTQTLTLTLAQLVLSPVEPCHPLSPQISVRPSVVLCHVASRMGVLLEEPGSREWLKWREIVFWTVAIGDGALSLHPRCSLNVAWTSGVHSGAEWRSWVDGYWWGRDFRLTSCGVLCMWWVCHSRSVRVRGQLVGVDPPSFI